MAEQVLPHLTIPQYVGDFELGQLSAEEMVVDVTVQLRHFCDLHGIDYARCDGWGYDHYLAEKGQHD